MTNVSDRPATVPVTCQHPGPGQMSSLGTNPQRFAVIFDRYFPEVHRYVERRLGTEAADDLAADTFLVAFGERGRYPPEQRNARPWQPSAS